MTGEIQDTQWSQLSDFVAEKMGLHFPRERWDDLKRGFIAAAQEFGFENTAASIEWLLSVAPEKAHLQVLAGHLTIGETYFFRDRQGLEALAERILPELIHSRRGRDQRLRLWCAGCCSGEEAYTLAILVHQLLPDLRDWQVTITATDINAQFLHKATTGIYGDWSFRNAPSWLKQQYFKTAANGRFAIVPEIKKLVTFGHLNLAQDVYPALGNQTNAMDVILCRNVLMYFGPAQAQKVIGNLSNALVEGGWLLVSPSEASKALFPQFINVNYPGAILFQKSPVSAQTKPKLTAEAMPVAEFVAPVAGEYLALAPVTPPTSAAPAPAPVAAKARPDPFAVAQSLYSKGRYAEAVDTLSTMISENAPKPTYQPAVFSLLTRALANQGRLEDALVCCDRWIAADKTDAVGHYMRALVLMESGDFKQARSSIQRAILLRPDFVLAYFSLGNVARASGKMDEANRHFSYAQRLLSSQQPNDILPESDNLTAGQLTEIINCLTLVERVP